MNLNIDPSHSVGPIRPSTPFVYETDIPEPKDKTFGEMLKRAVDQVNDLQIDANSKVFKLAVGEIEDIHEVTVAMEKASLAMALTMEIRDRVVEAYQQLMRTAM